MLSYLRNHPFAVEAYFDYSLVVTFATPLSTLRRWVPECLELDTFQDQWTFLAVAMVQTRDLRPKGFPRFLGSDFFLTGYRVFVRYTTKEGRRLRGLYILQSETNRKRMEFLGNCFTRYRYKTTDIQERTVGEDTAIQSIQSGFRLKVRQGAEDVALPPYSPFRSWQEARRFAGPMPFTFSWLPESKEVLLIEGVRSEWTPAPVEVLDYDFPVLQERGLNDAVLANAFVVRNVPYCWKKGRVESWKA